MQKTICFRDFEDRDLDFIYKCKNDAKLNKYIVGEWRPFSYKEASDWLQGCMRDSPSYKFWAIATNDELENIIGWASLSDINREKGEANFHGIVIGNPDYQDGVAWIESYQLMFETVFSKFNFRKLYGSNLSIHPSSGIIAKSMFMTLDGIKKNEIIKGRRKVDLLLFSINSEVYNKHKLLGDYEFYKIQERILNNYKKKQLWN